MSRLAPALTRRQHRLPRFSTRLMTGQATFQTGVAVVALFLFFRFAKRAWTSLVFSGEGLYLDWPSR